MAPKRSAPPPPPPPPAASDEETASGSGSEEEEEEEEEEIAFSPPPPAAPKTMAPPPQKGQESEDEDEEEEEEEEEEEDEEEEEKTIQVPPLATKNPSPPPPNREESESSGEDEEEETDDEAPQPQPAPNQVAEGKGAKPSSGEDKKAGGSSQRTWSTDDVVRILEALAAHRREHGTLPQVEALAATLAGTLDDSDRSVASLQSKLKNLKRRYSLAANKGQRPSKEHDRRLFDLSEAVWGSTTTTEAANGGARREVAEMCELYPFLAEEVMELQKANPGLFKREFGKIDDDKACALDKKIKRQRVRQAKVVQRRCDLTKEVNRTLIDLVENIASRRSCL